MAYLGCAKKCDLIFLAKELGERVDEKMTLRDLKTLITGSKDYEEEFVKNILKVIVEDRVENEKRNFELQKLNLSVPLSETKNFVEISKLMPKFDSKEEDICLYLVLFERQAKRAKIEKNEWVSQLLTLLPTAIVQIIAREPEEKSDDYDYIKGVLLKRFKMSPDKFRQKFVQEQKPLDSSWQDFAFILSSFLDEWLKGLEIVDFDQLKDLMITDQMKRRVTNDVREHFIDSWTKISSSSKLAEMLEEYEDVRRGRKKPDKNPPEKKVFRDYVKTFKPEPNVAKTENRRYPNNLFDKRKNPVCYECGSPSHLRPQCPKLEKLKKREGVTSLNRLVEQKEKDLLAPYTFMGEVNGVQMPILRDSGANIDVICRKHITPDMYTGESVWVQTPLDEGPKCLPIANVEIRGDFGKIVTKAAVVRSDLDKGRYLLGNRTAKKIKEEALPLSDIPCLVGAVQTRAQLAKENVEDCIVSTHLNPENESEEVDDDTAEVSDVTPDDPGLSLLKINKIEFVKKQRESEDLREYFEDAQNTSESGNRKSSFIVEGEMLFKIHRDRLGEERKLLVVPIDFRKKILALCHDDTSGHLGVTKSKDRLAKLFFWPKCYNHMEDYVKTCDSCQRGGKPNDKKKAPMKIVPVINEVFAKINIDACGPLPITSNGNKYIITAICLSSKYPDAVPVSDLTSISVTDALLNIFSRTGFPKEVQSDQGTYFTSLLTSEFFDRFGIKVSHSSVYHPQSNPVERFHRTLKRLLRVMKVETGEDWERHLPLALIALRTAIHESTGFSPAELVYGKNLRMPETLLYEHWTEEKEPECPVTEYVFKLINKLKRCQDIAVKSMEDVQLRRKKWYDRNAVKREFMKGDLVLVLAVARPNKLAVQWNGPGIIENKLSETNYIVKIPVEAGKSQIYHVNMLKPYYKREEEVNFLAAEEVNFDLEFPCMSSDPNVYDFSDIISKSNLEDSLNKDQIQQLKNLLKKYSKIFTKVPGVTHLVQHDIKLNSDEPVRSKPYRASKRQTEILKKEIQRMLDMKIIEETESDYASPMILVEVPNKDPRPCVDYRRLNAITRAEYYPLPNIEDRIELVASAKFITILDLSKGYWQIPLTPNAQRIAAFVTSFGTYRPLRLPFGLRNAPYFFSKLMAELLKGCELFALPYLDDIAIFSNTWEEHISHLSKVLHRIAQAGLTINPSKCRFAQEKVLYLGHVVGRGFRMPSDLKVEAITKFPTPKTKSEVRSFLGLVGYYNHYIPRFSEIAAPLTDLLKGKMKKMAITWNENCERAFRILKEKLSSKPLLYAPNFDKQFVLQTDASEIGMGAVLSQFDESNNEHPVIYLSKKFSDAEKKYGTTEKECASIIFAIKRLHYYLDGQEFLIQTDHNPLKWLQSNASTNPRLMRWALVLQPYNFKIEHRAGSLNKNADSLSRAPVDDEMGKE